MIRQDQSTLILITIWTTRRNIKIWMEGYLKQVRKQFQCSKPAYIQYGPTKYAAPEYGKKIQYTGVNITPELSPKENTYIQEVCGKFPYSGR